WAIRRALHPDPLGRLTRAAEIGGARGVIREYRTIKPWYPPVTLNEFLLNRVGYGLLQSGKVDDAIAVFRLNVEEHATAANTHDSLGEAYATRGNWALAIRSYERSLQLDRRNRNAAQRLEQLRKCMGGAVGDCPKVN
ncbi:MAG TPA: tetratricopeptide repeat protein, partial [Usitatibacteraceae bacterium]|nr:tetratricopeptide repeat protein [Usitatibacteraceae bacterium]